MITDSYKQALRTAREERSKLLHERATIDKKITQLEKMIESLKPLCDESESIVSFPTPLSDYKFADACRIVLRTSGQFLSPITIRDILVREGYDLSTQSNALASIHAILKRMVIAGEADEQTVEGKSLYRFKSNFVSALKRRMSAGYAVQELAKQIKEAEAKSKK